jgi:hypothetical protein
MAMTAAQQKKMTELEGAMNDLFQLLRGTGSKNMLNRLYVLLNREIERITLKVDELEESVEEILEYARKAQ